MSSQDVMIRSRLAHLRDLRAEIARLKEENSRLRDEVSSVKAHLSRLRLKFALCPQSEREIARLQDFFQRQREARIRKSVCVVRWRSERLHV